MTTSIVLFLENRFPGLLLASFVLLFSFCSQPVLSQGAPSKLWIEFTDKQNVPYSLSKPGAFLSDRAIERRQRLGIKFDKTDLPVDSSYVQQVRQTGVNILYASKWMNAVAVELEEATTTPQQLQQLSFVKRIDTVAVFSSGKRQQLRKKFLNQFEDISGFNEDFYGFGYNQIRMVSGQRLHQLGLKGRGIRIAVMDAGFFKVDQLPFFSELQRENRILDTYDFVEMEKNVFDEGFHGAMVLSTMAANSPGNFVGTAPEADYLLYRTEDGGSEFIIEEHNWIAAAERADSAGADVFNTSLGYTQFNDSTMDHTYQDMDGNTAPITRAADLAAKKGIIVVNSAGNSGLSPWHYISAPADGDRVVSVGAVRPNRSFEPFSSRGPTWDDRIKPNVAAQGQNTVVYHPNREKLVNANGTSFSSPIVAGMFACLRQAHPDKPAWELVKEVQQNASNAPQKDTLTGYGVPNFYEAHLSSVGEDNLLYQREQLPRAYPNPVENELHIMVHDSIPRSYSLQIYDLEGNRLYKRKEKVDVGGFYKFSIPQFQQLSEGMYLLELDSEGDDATFRIWKGTGFQPKR